MELVNHTSFYAHGKLLLTAEYAVLDGAKALCLPTKHGQGMRVEVQPENFLLWNAYLPDKSLWFSAKLNKEFELIYSTNETLGLNLSKIFKSIKNLSNQFIFKPLKISTYLEFDKNWGLGSSSTLISLLAQWSAVNPYDLLEQTFGGSGYDIACATASEPIFFRNRKFIEANFNPSFQNNLYFIYLNKKQNSREAISLYKSKPINHNFINKISFLTDKIAQAKTLRAFEDYINEHESIISNHLQVPRIQERLFSDYTEGVIKSLGGWGGDFILVTCQQERLDYFKTKGYSTIFPYSELIL